MQGALRNFQKKKATTDTTDDLDAIDAEDHAAEELADSEDERLMEDAIEADGEDIFASVPELSDVDRAAGQLVLAKVCNSIPFLHSHLSICPTGVRSGQDHSKLCA